MTLGSVLMVVALLATLGMALAGGTISHHHLLQTSTQRESARNLARSAVNLAFERLLRDPSLGRPHTPTQKVEVTLQGEFSESTGLVVFDPQLAAQLRVPPSLNNLEMPQSKLDGQGQTVPPNAVRLYGVGRCRGVEQVVEATLVVPPFPWALGSGGSITAEEGLEIGALRAMPANPAKPGPLLPADIVSNLDTFLGPHTRIEGDVQAAGTVTLSPQHAGTIQVKGEIRSHAKPTRIPELDLQAFDPASKGLAFTSLHSGDLSSGDPVRGAFRREGPLSVRGDLELKGGLVFVNGDLEISGGVKGKGMVVATGKIRVAGSTSLEGSNSVALMSGGDMTLHGRGIETSAVEGLVYTQGNFRAESVSVLGTLVAGKDSHFRDARFVSVEGTHQVDLSQGSSSSNRVDLAMQLNPQDLSLTPAGTQAVGPQAIDATKTTGYVLSITRVAPSLAGPEHYRMRLYEPASLSQAANAAGDLVLISEEMVTDPSQYGMPPQGTSFRIPFAAISSYLPSVAGPDNPDQKPDPTAAIQPNFKVDLSTVLQLKDRIRLCQWKES